MTEEPSAPSSPPPETSDPVASPHKHKTSIAEDVIHKKGMYGRFADKWFSRKGWAADSRRAQGMSSEEDLSEASTLQLNPTVTVANDQEHEGQVANFESFGLRKSDEVAQVPPQEISKTAKVQADAIKIPMLPKVLTVSKMLFSSKSFYFAYDYDLSRSLLNQPNTSSTSPLYRNFDPFVSTFSLTPSFYRCLGPSTDAF